MRIARLDLEAFGPFTDRSLDFSGGSPGGLHLIYGRNAAGKSSALRAVADLLFGIPLKSKDDHVHPYQALRIRALIETSTGESLVMQRLKRNKDSLRDEHDAPLDEVALKRMLGSVDRAMFERVFGLNHERLRDAGRALLEGGGDVGESLFDAGSGGQGVRRVLARLREEAERLFKPRGGKQEIARLLESYKAAQQRVRNATHPPEAYVQQQRELERQQSECEQLGRELSLLRREREHSRLLFATLKGIAHRHKLTAQLQALGPLPELPEGFSERREKVQASLVTHQLNVERIGRDLSRLEQRAAELAPPAGLVSVGKEAMAVLRERIGSTKKALSDLPSREAALAEHRAAAQLGERRLGLDATRPVPEALSSRVGEARFRRLLAERGARAERERAARDRLADAELDLATHRARLEAMPLSEDPEGLERAVLLSRHVGDVESALDDTRRELQELDLLARAELAELAPFEGTLGELCSLPLPAEETVARFERAFVEADEQIRQVAEESARSRRRAAELSHEMAAEQRAGPVPSEEDLDQARRARDVGFDELCKTVSSQEAQGPSWVEASRLLAYRSLVSAADTLADRLRREASRVAESARRRVELEETAREQQRLAEIEARLGRGRRQLERDWASSWQVTGIPPVRPGEVRAWLGRRQRAVALAVRQTALARREDSLQTQTRELRDALGESGRDGPLAVAVARAQDLLDRQRFLAAERQALRDRIAQLEVRVAVARRELQASEQESQQSEADLSRAIGELGFEGSLAPEEVEWRLEALTDLVRARDQSADLERRIAGMRRDIEHFEADVAELVLTHAGDLSSLPAWRAAGELVERFERGRRDADSLARITEEIEERRFELEEHRALLGRAEGEACELLAMARAQSLGELVAVEARTRQARELRAELDGLDATLGEAAGGRGLEALFDEAAGTDPVRLSARLGDLDGAIEQLEERYSDSIRSHQRVQAGLELFADTSAVLAAEEERALAASVVVRAEQWARLKLAELLLAREVERYRQQHQGPILRRASELFVGLTRGEFSGLRVGREERSLVVVRQTDLEVTVDGLNEAARYHLYLALRLASLERYLDHAESLPLVLDDVLIHFDEDGAHAALRVLQELSARVQILLFTHHKHNLELAEAAVPSGRLFLHEL